MRRFGETGSALGYGFTVATVTGFTLVAWFVFGAKAGKWWTRVSSESSLTAWMERRASQR